MSKAWKHKLEYGLILALKGLFRAMPRAVALKVGEALGLFAGCVLRIRRAVVDANLEIAFGREKTRAERNRIARGCYCHYGAVMVDTLRLFGKPATEWYRLVEGVEGLEATRAQLQEHAGLVVMTAHLGLWELGYVFPLLDMPMCVVAKPAHNPYIQAMIDRGREQENYDVMSTGASVRMFVQYLRQGWALGFVSDQDARRNGIFVDYFGRPASTATGGPSFAVKLHKPLIFFCITRQKSGRYVIAFDPPAERRTDLSRQEEIVRLTAAYMKRMEEMVRRHPEQYWWFHRRWKSTPENRRKRINGGAGAGVAPVAEAGVAPVAGDQH